MIGFLVGIHIVAALAHAVAHHVHIGAVLGHQGQAQLAVGGHAQGVDVGVTGEEDVVAVPVHRLHTAICEGFNLHIAHQLDAALLQLVEQVGLVEDGHGGAEVLGGDHVDHRNLLALLGQG